MNNRQGSRSSKHLVSLACTFHSVVFNLKDMHQRRVICSHKICILKSRFLASKKTNILPFLSRHSYPFIVMCYAQKLLNFTVKRTAYNLSMSWCRPSSSCLSTVVQSVTHVACLFTILTCVALALPFAPVIVCAGAVFQVSRSILTAVFC